MVYGSTWEANVYQALVKLKIDFQYQVPWRGGRIRGGSVIDFIVQVPPNQVALYVDGPYWHRKERAYEDEIIRADLEKSGYTVLSIKEEAESYEGALAWAKDNLK